MKTILTTADGNMKVLDLPDTEESVFWKEIGKQILGLPIPNTLSIETAQGNAFFTLKQRGTFIKNGEKKPSLYVVPEYNNVRLSPSEYEDAYLTCINPESNNYKFYWFKPREDGLHATYGRIGSERGEMFGTKDLKNPYEPYLYWIRYYEKIGKGYVDQTDIYLAPKKVPKKKVVRKDPAYELYQELIKYAKKTVVTHLENENVTENQIREAKKALNQMRNRKTVKGFNNQLMKLMAVSPRKARYLTDFLAEDVSDFPEILAREEDIVNSMEAVTIEYGSFRDYKVEVYYATDVQKEEVLSQLSPRLQAKVDQIYRVIPKKEQEDFNAYLKKKNIRKVKQLWHGSRNCNWISIIKNGLSLNPDAIITGKMFGNGIYFAPSSEKSWNYTSFRGTTWAFGTEDVGFMGLYATAYGEPLDVYSSYHYQESDLIARDKNCVHAHRGIQLRNDEIIYYNEKAMVLNYVVRFK